MYKVILDTNYIVGLIDEKDIHHKTALLIENRLIKINAQFVYLDCVINEVVNVLIKRANEKKYAQKINNLLEQLHLRCPKEDITWIYSDIENYYGSIIQMVKKSEGSLNFHDSLIVLMANEFEISHIVSFDKDFDKTRLKRIKNARDI
jgi:predicted nucleic acid-binding protein